MNNEDHTCFAWFDYQWTFDELFKYEQSFVRCQIKRDFGCFSVLPHVLGGAAAGDAHRRPRLGQQPQKDRQGVVRQDGQNGKIL